MKCLGKRTTHKTQNFDVVQFVESQILDILYGNVRGAKGGVVNRRLFAFN